MSHKLILLPSLAFVACMAGAQTNPPQTKVGVIHVQNAILGTRDGQKAAADLQARYEPRRKAIEGRQTEIAGLREQLSRGSNTMSEEMKQSYMRQIDQKTKALNRDAEDAQADLEQDQNKILQELGQKMMVVIDKYSRDNGFALILDISSPQTPVLYAANAIDITQDIIGLYDKNTAGAPAAAPAAPAKPEPAPAKK